MPTIWYSPGYALGVGAKQKFEGTLRPDGTGLRWTVITVPFDPTRVWPRRQRLRVQGTINGAAFRTSLFKARDGSYILMVNKKMQKEAGVRHGHLAQVVLEPDLAERPQTTPPELEKLLRQDRALRKFHQQLSDSMRKAIADQIEQPKAAEVRTGRAELWAERMLLAMEGETTTPPILEAAFLRQPKARDGWRAMTPVQRRGHLMGIFYYQSPESRQKRARKAIDEALKVSGKKPAL
ncbi:MAG TPA: YdeI/OmpD-associated family protein [Acidobacteriaceae bacterium]